MNTEQYGTRSVFSQADLEFPPPILKSIPVRELAQQSSGEEDQRAGRQVACELHGSKCGADDHAEQGQSLSGPRLLDLTEDGMLLEQAVGCIDGHATVIET